MPSHIELESPEKSKRGLSLRGNLLSQAFRRAFIKVPTSREIRDADVESFSKPFVSDARIISIKDRNGNIRTYVGRLSDFKKMGIKTTLLSGENRVVNVLDSEGNFLGKATVEIVGDGIRSLKIVENK